MLTPGECLSVSWLLAFGDAEVEEETGNCNRRQEKDR